MGSRICRSKIYSASIGLCLDTHLGVGLLVGHLPLEPCLVSFRALLPIIISARKLLCCEHHGGEKKEQGFVGDYLPRSAGFPLGVLEHINILGDYLELKVIAMHFIMQKQEVKGLPDRAP